MQLLVFYIPSGGACGRICGSLSGAGGGGLRVLRNGFQGRLFPPASVSCVGHGGNKIEIRRYSVKESEGGAVRLRSSEVRISETRIWNPRKVGERWLRVTVQPPSFRACGTSPPACPKDLYVIVTPYSTMHPRCHFWQAQCRRLSRLCSGFPPARE